MGKMAAFHKYCSVTGILGWGKHILGRKASCPEKGGRDVANEWQIIAP